MTASKTPSNNPSNTEFPLFSDLPLIEPIQSALRSKGYTIPTPIQAGAIPPLLEGRDFLGCAQTGTGKTAAFAIPILQLLHQSPAKAVSGAPRALVLCPTRELAVQILESFTNYGKSLRLRFAAVFGGVGQSPQVTSLTRGLHVLVATPGRLQDLMDQGHCSLSRLEYFVLDEADRMLDMGFMPAIKRIVAKLPKQRQSIFLSATMPPPIEELAGSLLRDHVTVMITPPATTAQKVAQRVMFVDKDNKRKLLESLLESNAFSKVLVFVRTKYGADRLAKSLKSSTMMIDAIHGDKSQGARQRVLNGFKDGELRVLVATDVAARGIDVEGITHVINYDMPMEPDGYVHRIGRTARAGATGESISMCDAEEFQQLRQIEREIGKRVPVDRNHPYHSADAEDEVIKRDASSGRKKTSRGRPTTGPRAATAGGAAGRSRKGFKGTKTSSSASSSTTAGSEAAPGRRRSISGKVKKINNSSTKPQYGYSAERKPNNNSSSGPSSGPRKKKR
jgi:ATP-dependent RNA helicase RhlE